MPSKKKFFFRRLLNPIFSHNLASIFTFDHRPVSTTSESTTSSNWNLITKMRDLRARSPYALFLKDNYSEISAKNPGKRLLMMIIKNEILLKKNFRFKIS